MQKICIINKSRNKTNENSILKNKKTKKIKVVLVAAILMMIVNIPINVIFAEENNNFSDYHIYSYESSNRYIKYQGRPQRIYEYYYINKEQKQLPAYCMNLGLNGAETVEGGYDVNASEYVSDSIDNNIILNGYPYKSVEELKVANESEARYATQFALWVKRSNLDINQISPMEDSYLRVVNAIKQIYNNGISNFLNYTNGVQITEVKKDSILDDIDSSFYSKIYELNYGDNILDININVEGINDYTIVDENNNKIDNITKYKKIKILFPRKSNLENAECKINISSSFKENAVLFAKTKVAGMQDMSLSLEPIKKTDQDIKFKLETLKTKLEILKKDAEDGNILIPNVKFNIYDLDNKLLGTFITDSYGKINIDVESNLKIFKNSKIKIEEVEVPYPYVIDKDNNTKIIDLKVGDSVKVEFKNNKIKEIPKVELPKTGF